VVDGYEFLRLVASSARYKSIPIIVLSAAVERPALGVTEFLAKPFRIEALREAITRHCGEVTEGPVAPARKRAAQLARVVVVGDEEIVRDVLTRLLEYDGDVAVTSVDTAESAADELDRESYDVLVVDKNL